MNVYTALSLFSLIILIYWVITELFTILFRFTGLPDERARFQVISLLTGCGYTTRESEMFLSNRPRRRLARITMLFGYVFNITIVSAFINVFLSLKLSQVEHFYVGILIPLAAVTVIFIFMRVPRVRAWGDDMLQKVADHIIGRTDSFNTVMLLDYIGADSIALVTLHSIPEERQGVPLSETGLRADTGILVMLVEKPRQKAVPAGADTVFEVGDKLTVFGNYNIICKAFHAKERFSDN
ncbi:MAG: TrkA C-terminal domain-containing protein [Oscillospiraceae bacterium]|nr:TrkA C-terminal domain-containing protein [Oscillospiraceae bacterium]